MKNLTAMEVVMGHQVVSDPLRQLIDVFVPTVELDIPDGKTFLSEHPMAVLKEGAINKVPSIIGFNADEGLLNSAGMNSFLNATFIFKFSLFCIYRKFSHFTFLQLLPETKL